VNYIYIIILTFHGETIGKKKHISKNNEIYFWGQCGDVKYNIPTKIQ